MTPAQRAQFDTWPADTQARFQFHAGHYDAAVRRRSRDVSMGRGMYGPERRWGHGMGGLAEDYVARRLGVPWNVSTVPDGGLGDLVWNGLRVDVKWTPYATGRLFAPAHLVDHLLADLYVLVCGDDPAAFIMAGFATRAQVIGARVDDLGKGPTLVVPREHLLPPAGLILNAGTWF